MTIFSIVLIVILGIILIIFLILLFIHKLSKKLFKYRFDGDPRFKFFTSFDYPGLNKEIVSIDSSFKYKLNGAVFSYQNDSPKGVIIFYPGLYSGYINYLNIIEYFARKGFIVISFDALGSMSSGGTSIKGMPTIDKDNKNIINYVINNPKYNKYPIFTLGHSWGAHAALTSLLHDDFYIKKAIGLSPYNSNVDVNYSVVPFTKVLSPFIYLYNLIRFGHESTYTVTSALKYTTAEVKIYTGEKDHIVKSKYSYKKYKKTMEKEKLSNVELIHYIEDGHFLYLSKEGEKHFVKEVSFPRKSPIDFKKLDYKLIYDLDYSLLDEIIAFLLD